MDERGGWGKRVEAASGNLERTPPDHLPSAPDSGPLPPAADAGHEARDAAGRPGGPLTDSEHSDHVAKVRDRLDKARADGLATTSYVKDRDREVWARDRRLGHNAIIADMYQAASGVPCERRAVLAGGLPGAGKTTVLEQHSGVDRSRYMTINPDDVKAEMAKRGMIPKVPGLSPMEASDLVHEESSHVAKRLARRAMRDGKNVIWDITMASEESTSRRIDDLRGFGYSHVEGVFVDIPVQVAHRRAEARHREGNDGYRAGSGLGGRYVGPEVIDAQRDAEWGSCNRRTFESLKPRFDAWAIYDNGVDGRDPLLVDARRKGDGQ